MRHRPVRVDTPGEPAVSFQNLQTGGELTITAGYILDATDEGDLLPLAACTLWVRNPPQTGEPHALPGPADPMDQQAITWCAALEWRPGEDHTIDSREL